MLYICVFPTHTLALLAWSWSLATQTAHSAVHNLHWTHNQSWTRRRADVEWSSPLGLEGKHLTGEQPSRSISIKRLQVSPRVSCAKVPVAFEHNKWQMMAFQMAAGWRTASLCRCCSKYCNISSLYYSKPKLAGRSGWFTVMRGLTHWGHLTTVCWDCREIAHYLFAVLTSPVFSPFTPPQVIEMFNLKPSFLLLSLDMCYWCR